MSHARVQRWTMSKSFQCGPFVPTPRDWYPVRFTLTSPGWSKFTGKSDCQTSPSNLIKGARGGERYIKPERGSVCLLDAFWKMSTTSTIHRKDDHKQYLTHLARSFSRLGNWRKSVGTSGESLGSLECWILLFYVPWRWAAIHFLTSSKWNVLECSWDLGFFAPAIQERVTHTHTELNDVIRHNGDGEETNHNRWMAIFITFSWSNRSRFGSVGFPVTSCPLECSTIEGPMSNGIIKHNTDMRQFQWSWLSKSTQSLIRWHIKWLQNDCLPLGVVWGGCKLISHKTNQFLQPQEEEECCWSLKLNKKKP